MGPRRKVKASNISDIFSLKMKKDGLRIDGILFDENHFPERYMLYATSYPESGVFVAWMGLVNIILSTFLGLVLATKYKASCQKQDFNNLLLRFPELQEELQKLDSGQSLSLSPEQIDFLIRNSIPKTKTIIIREKKYIEERLAEK
jgi:hypothetical protein